MVPQNCMCSVLLYLSRGVIMSSILAVHPKLGWRPKECKQGLCFQLTVCISFVVHA